MYSGYVANIFSEMGRLNLPTSQADLSKVAYYSMFSYDPPNLKSSLAWDPPNLKSPLAWPAWELRQ